MAPAPLSFKTRGGGGALGGVAYKDRAWLPPRGWHKPNEAERYTSKCSSHWPVTIELGGGGGWTQSYCDPPPPHYLSNPQEGVAGSRKEGGRGSPTQTEPK